MYNLVGKVFKENVDMEAKALLINSIESGEFNEMFNKYPDLCKGDLVDLLKNENDTIVIESYSLGMYDDIDVAAMTANNILHPELSDQILTEIETVEENEMLGFSICSITLPIEGSTVFFLKSDRYPQILLGYGFLIVNDNCDLPRSYVRFMINEHPKYKKKSSK